MIDGADAVSEADSPTQPGSDDVFREGAGQGAGDRPPVGMLADVLEGLARPQKELSSKYFYDHVGSELFEEITRLPEYYLSRTEEQLLDGTAPSWVAGLEPGTLVELGAGSARKTRALLDAMTAVGSGRQFVPIDVSGDFLDTTVRQVRTEYPGLAVTPIVADITQPLTIDRELPSPVLFVLLGSTIGNFPGRAGIRLLAGVRSVMASADRLLVGLDLRPTALKSRAEIEAAYNDAAGVTAAFNLNVLAVVNAQLGADFDVHAFGHRAFYDPVLARIEMHLVSRSAQDVRVGGAVVHLKQGETIRTEISGKYDRESATALFAHAGLVVDRWATDPQDRFAMVWAGPGRQSAVRR